MSALPKSRPGGSGGAPLSVPPVGAPGSGVLICAVLPGRFAGAVVCGALLPGVDCGAAPEAALAEFVCWAPCCCAGDCCPPDCSPRCGVSPWPTVFPCCGAPCCGPLDCTSPSPSRLSV